MKCTEAAKQKNAPTPPPENNGRRKLHGFVLDCDGVLFDSKAANTAYYNHIRHAVHLPPMSMEEATYSHMASTEEALERIIPNALKQEAIRIRKATSYRDTFMPMMQPSPHMVTFLQNMQKLGLPLALCTNRSDSVHEVLQHFGIDHFFALIITITRAQPKPSPEGLLQISTKWNTEPASLAFLGDSLVDQQAASAAGMPFWSYDNPDLKADLHISNFKELNEIIKAMLM